MTAVTAKPTTDSTSCVTEAAKAHTFTEPPKIPAEVFYTLRPEAR